MQRRNLLLITCSVFVGALMACNGGEDADLLVEDATFVAALSEGEGESAEGTPEGDAAAAGEEAANDEVEGEAHLSDDCSLAGLRRNVIATYDEDGDGKLDGDEREALREDFGPRPFRHRRAARHHLLRRLKWIYDADGSRTLDEAERQELRNDLEQRCLNRKAALLEEFDADGDGELSEDEWLAAREALVAKRAQRRAEILEQFDANDDGVLDREERMALYMALRARFEARREALRQQFDTDGSGTLDAAEREALKEYLKTRVRGEHL